jgi:hypothetical protein
MVCPESWVRIREAKSSDGRSGSGSENWSLNLLYSESCFCQKVTYIKIYYEIDSLQIFYFPGQ